MSAANANPKATPAKTPNSSKKASTNKHGFENNDVICGVGNFTNHGNVVLNELVEECIPVFYQKDTSREDKQMLMENIYDAIETLGGRFMDNKSKEQLTRKEALVKIKTKINNTRSKLNRLQAKAKLKAAVKVAVLATSASSAKTKKPDPEEEKPATTTPEPPKPAATEKAPTKKPDPAATPAAPSATPAAPVLQEAITVASSPAPAADKNNNNKNRIQVERNRLLTGDMDEAHALGLLGKLRFATEEAKAQSSRLLLAQLNREKDQLLAWANQELRQAMVGEAVKVGLISSNNDMEAAFLEIVKAGEKGDDNQDKIRSVAHALFYPHDKGPSPWIIAKQVEYLERQNLIYQSDEEASSKPAISSTDYGYVYTLIASELETLGAKIAAPNDKKRSGPSDASAEEEQPSPNKKAKVEATSKAEEEEDDSDESVPIAVLKQQKDAAAMAAAAVAPKEVVAVLEDTSSSSKSESVTKATEPAPATAPTAVVVETVDEAQEEEEEVPVPTSQAMGVQVHASATQPAEKIHIVTASGIQIPTRMDKTTTSGNEEGMEEHEQPPQDYAPQEESTAVQEVYDEKPLNVMDPSTWTAEQKVLVAIGGICFVLLGLQLMV